MVQLSTIAAPLPSRDRSARPAASRPIPASALLAAHRAVAAWVPLCEQLAMQLGREPEQDGCADEDADFAALRALRRAASRLLPRSWSAYGFLRPVRPHDGLVRQVETELTRLPGLVRDALASDLAGLTEHDLNSGLPVAPGQAVAAA